jgi:hypothetical protein
MEGISDDPSNAGANNFKAILNYLKSNEFGTGFWLNRNVSGYDDGIIHALTASVIGL